MKTKKIIFIAILIILIGISIFLITKTNLTGQTIEGLEFYSFTKAICNATNYCQDYVITCEGNEVTDTSAITGAFVQNGRNWKDPRTQEEIEKIC